MNKIYIIIVFCIVSIGCKEVDSNYLQQADVKLGVPFISGAGDFITDQARAEIFPPIEDCIIYYRTNQDLDFRIYNGPIELKGVTKLEAKAAKGDYIDSDTVVQQFVDITTNKVIDIESTTLASSSYPGNGPLSLSDVTKGSTNFKDGNWLGYQEDTVSYTITIKESKNNKVVLSFLQNQDNWIFLPESVYISWVESLTGLTKSTKVAVLNPDQQNAAGFEYLEFVIEPMIEAVLKIDIVPLTGIPEWHAGKGTKPWLFIDEILVL